MVNKIKQKPCMSQLWVTSVEWNLNLGTMCQGFQPRILPCLSAAISVALLRTEKKKQGGRERNEERRRKWKRNRSILGINSAQTII